MAGMDFVCWTPSPPKKSRRPSVSRLHLNLHNARAGSASFLNLVDTPSTASAKRSNNDFDVPFDLTRLGYTNVFVRLPATPAFARSASPRTLNHPSPPAQKPKTPMRRLRSFGILKRPRAKSLSNSNVPPVPPMPPVNVPLPLPIPLSPKRSSSRITQKKKALYPASKSRPAKHKAALPPSLANELALMQFMDGGSMDDCVRRVMEAQAKADAAAGSAKNNLPMGDVYRDDKGGLWRDRDEELEYTHLLADDDTDTQEHGKPGPRRAGWITFAGKENLSLPQKSPIPSPTASSPTTSDIIDLSRVVKPLEEGDPHLFRIAAMPRLLSAPCSPLPPPSPSAAPLTPTSRRRRRPSSPPSPTSLIRGHTRSRSLSRSRSAQRKRRPPPLPLRPDTSSNDARQAFLAASFMPSPPPSSSGSTLHLVGTTVPASSSVRGRGVAMLRKQASRLGLQVESATEPVQKPRKGGMMAFWRRG